MAEIGGFQAVVVDEVPEVTRAGRGIYGDIIEAVPDAPSALKIDIGDPKRAAVKVAGLRGFLRRHNKRDDYVVVRQGAVIFVSKKG